MSDESWPDIRTRGRILHFMACGGASLHELDQFAGHDPAAVIVAIRHAIDNVHDYEVVAHDVVANRLRRLLRTIDLHVAA